MMHALSVFELVMASFELGAVFALDAAATPPPRGLLGISTT